MANAHVLTPDDIREILLSDATQASLCRQFGVSRETIHRLRSGKSHRQLWPEIERVRTIRATCPKCVQWGRKGCGLGIPESQEPGVGQHWASCCPAFIRSAHPEPIADAPP